MDCKRIDLYGLRFGETASDEVRQRLPRLRPAAASRAARWPISSGQGVLLPGVRGQPGGPHPAPGHRAGGHRVPGPCPRHDNTARAGRGHGSGCLAVAIARRHPGASVTAVDISPEALAVAGRNAARHAVAPRVRFLQGDLFTSLPAGEQFDFIVVILPTSRATEIRSSPRASAITSRISRSTADRTGSRSWNGSRPRRRTTWSRAELSSSKLAPPQENLSGSGSALMPTMNWRTRSSTIPATRPSCVRGESS